ncbi:type II secretion system protein [Oryzomonas sagensis]|uniref:Type II secretion system protein n=1 Tax=Oryzomonas sagensis TaxID=2603857 RepID=A0ABQ6TLL7_9BACT|nr:cohesin domain-containing protein [Oryzomonas sagensis]KAB0669321.1 type II secretion system protein [Oryzomonas sagensis]
MRYLIHLNILCLLGAVVSLSGCTGGRQAFSTGERFETEGRYEEAMYSYAEAFRKEPEVGEYRVRFLSARQKAAEKHYKNGLEQSARGDYAAALEAFQSAYGLDPGQAVYKQQAEAAGRMKEAQAAFLEGVDFEKSNKFKEASRAFTQAVSLRPDNKEYQAALRRVAGMRKNKLEGFELSLKSAKPITLKFKDAKIKDVFSILTRLSGINFVFDDGVKDQNITIYIENGTFQQALDLLTNMFKLGRKVLNESTVIIYPKQPDKVKQYEEMEVRTFHLNYLEAKKAINLIRGMIQVRKIQVNEDANSIIVRDTKDVVDVVDKILDAHDVPEPEVVLDVEVVELNDSNTENVGLLLNSYNVQLGGFAPDGTALSSSLATTTSASTSTTSSTSSSSTISSLIRAFSIKGYGGYVTVPNATYNFGKTLTKGEVLSNPKVRVKNKEKSKFTVGTRVPITTTTTTNSTTSVNVQYVDVGVKVNAEPTIQLNNEVTIKLSLEVSSILSTETVGSTDSATKVVTIGTRNLETVLSLKDGETSVIGGLISRTNSDSKSKVFLLGDLPLIGPLLSNSNGSKAKTELVLAITPRLIRGVTVPQVDLSAFMSGKEDDPSLVRPLGAFEEEPVYATEGNASAAQAEAATEPSPKETKATQGPRRPRRPAPSPSAFVPAPAPAPAPAAPAPAPAAPAAVAPVPAAAATTLEKERLAKQKADQERMAAEKNEPEQAAAKPAPGGGALPGAAPAPAPAAPLPQSTWVSDKGMLEFVTPSSIAVGQQFTVAVRASFVKDLIKAPFVLAYDPAKLEYVSILEGPLLGSDNKPTFFSGEDNPGKGTVTVSLSRKVENVGVSGTGTIASLTFKAKKAGAASFVFSDVNFVAAGGKPYEMLPFSRVVNVTR